MNTWNITVTATLDRPPADFDAYRLGREIAGAELLAATVHDARYSVHTRTEAYEPAGEVARLTRMFAARLAHEGFSIVRWEAVECLSADEVDRRLASASMPPLVSAEELAELCGVTKQRVYELEGERRKRAAAGEVYPFPTPVVPGWWLQSAAKHYAATRKTKPGPDADPAGRAAALRRRAGLPAEETPREGAIKRRMENPPTDA